MKEENKDMNTKKAKVGKHKKGKKGLKIFLIILAIILVLLGAICGVGFWYVQDKLGKINYVDIDESQIDITEGVKENLKDYRNIVILGIDAREATYTGSRSDSIIIASINNKTNEVRLTSVYRDSYLELTGRSLDKVTHAYAFGGPTLTMSTLNTNLDLNITEFVTVNFDSTVEIIDAIGGININIASDEVAHISGINSTGKQRLNGSQALQYARIRYEAGGDYKRTERMRTVLMAVFDKAKTLSIGQLNNLADTLLPKIYTNINTGEILSMIPQIASFKIVNSEGWPYEVKGITLDRWYGVPVTLEENVKELHKNLFGEEDYQPSEKVKEISEKIIKKTGYQ